MAQPVPTLLCRPELQVSAGVTVKNTFIDGHADDDSDLETAKRGRHATCPDVSPSQYSETTAPGESPASATPDSTLTSSSGESSRMKIKVEKTFFKIMESDSSTPRSHGNRNLTWGPTMSSSSCDLGDAEESTTPRGDRPGTMEQWPEYPGYVAKSQSQRPSQPAPQAGQPWPPSAQPPNPTMTPCINLCNALPTAHPAHPTLGGPIVPAGMMYPAYPHPMVTPYQLPHVPALPQLSVPWIPMDHLVHAQHAAALSAAVTAASLCSALTAPVLPPMPAVPPSVPQPYVAMPHFPAMAAPQPAQAEVGGPLPAAGPNEAEGEPEKKHRSRRARLWAHIYLRMQLEGFDLVPRLIGRKGCNMRRIADQTSAKVRIRGQGSGHLEIDGKFEAPTPLMIAVTTDHADPEMFKLAIQMTLKVLKAVEGCFHAFCARKGIEHSGPCYCVGMLQPNAQEALGSLLDNVPQNLEHETQITDVKTENQ